MKFDQDLCLNLWYKLNPRVRCAFGNVYFVPWSSSDLNAISQGLKPGGFLVVKENVTSSGEVMPMICQGFVKF